MKGVLSMGENKKEYKNENKKSKLSPVLITILMIGFGILLIVKPDLAVKILVIILGIVLLAGGAIFVLGWFFGGKDGGKGKGNANVKQKKTTADIMQLIGSIFVVIAGIVILVWQDFFCDIFPTVMGIIILVTGVVNLLRAFSLKKEEGKSWLVSLILSLAAIALGLLIIFNPFFGPLVLTRVTGVVLIYNAIASIWILKACKKASEVPGQQGQPSQKPAQQAKPVQQEKTGKQ